MPNEIKICMGSACFAKGNARNLQFIKKYLKDNNLKSEIKVMGALCENKCSEGPRIIVDGTEYKKITEEKIAELLKK